MTPQHLTGHVVVVTGVAQGLGFGTVRAVAAAGGTVVAADVVPSGADTASAPAPLRQASERETPLGRSGSVTDVAALTVFLLGSESTFISGADIPVDSGMTAHGGSKSIADAMFDRAAS